MIEMIKRLGYSFEKRDHIGAINIINPEGKKKAFVFGRNLERILYFGPDKIAMSERQLFEEIHNPTEEDMCFFQNGCSIRTHEYIEAEKKKIGYVGMSTEDDCIGKRVYGQETEFYHADMHSGIDDWCEYKYYFNHNPSKQDVIKARAIDDFESELRIGRIKEEFKCWECGKKSHFLDIPGDILTKIDCIRDKYCGC